ncbi:MAG: restriction endonuclease subunit S [Clostridiales bacterium]|nr:restriction endonuclease subunit S [Clostridiales bacterium]
MNNKENTNKMVKDECINHIHLIDVANVLYGYPLQAKNFCEDSSYLPVVRIRDIKAGFSTTYYRESVPMEYIVHLGDILVGMDGEFNLSKWRSREAILNQRVCKIESKDESIILNQYLFHLLGPIFKKIEKNIQGSTVKHLSAKIINSIKIPLPPLPIQQEIVRILDTFTNLTAELTNKLNAELTARRKQYEYYRDELLTFGEGVEELPIDEIATYRRGSFPQPYGNAEWYGGKGAMPFVQVADVEENAMRLQPETKQTISVQAQPKSVFVAKGTVICSIQGTIGRVAITQYDCYVDRTLAIFESYKKEIDKEYFAYQIKRKFGIEKEFARGSTLKTITKQEFSKFKIPLPSINEQRQIVSILNQFERLCNGLSSGLPAEIVARQKQYEYYRNQLLTFKQIGG